MNPRNYTMLQNWMKAEADKAHLIAVKYIEENVDLIDTDLQKFMDNCPRNCQLEVYEMLLKAGIDMKDYVINGSLKQWEKHIHYHNPYLDQCYTFDCKETLDKYIDNIVTWKTDWRHDAIVFDTISAIEEA